MGKNQDSTDIEYWILGIGYCILGVEAFEKALVESERNIECVLCEIQAHILCSREISAKRVLDLSQPVLRSMNEKFLGP